MSQFAKMFGSTRVPGEEKDETFVDPGSRHLLVIRHGQQFVFDVLDDQNAPIDGRQLLSNLAFVWQRTAPAGTTGLGSITAATRPHACRARQRLVQLGNADCLKAVDSALFALVLDDSQDEDDVCQVTSNFLGGPSESRWFDKSFSLLVDQRGRAAVNFEHSWGDGIAVMRLFQDAFNDSEAHPAVQPSDSQNLSSLPSPRVRRLEWLLDDRFREELLLPARAQYDQVRASLRLSCCEQQTALNKALCKQAQVSPDAMMQLSFQMAHDLVHGRPAATYESCSTAAFKHGRTETLRSATKETRHFVELMRGVKGQQVDRGQLWEALAACSKKHGQLAREAAVGQGWDRHLFALKKFAMAETPHTLPTLFTDENYQRINQIVLSTSTVQSAALRMFSFGPVSPDGYGLGYLIHTTGSWVMVSSWSGAKTAKAHQLAEALSESQTKLRELLKARCDETKASQQ